MSSSNGGNDKGLFWKLPVVKSKDLGKLGPGIGFGVGCGVGVGAGLFGGAGLGAGLPGLRIGIGIGAGCGIGLGFGYGAGKGIAYDENKRYSNVGKLFRGSGTGVGKFPNQKGIQSLVLEKSNSLRYSGAGITIYINGWRALDQLGLATELQIKAMPILEMNNALVDQKRIQVTPSRDEEFRCLRRSDLFEALADGVPAKSIRLGCQVVAVGTDLLTSFPVVHLDDGTTIKAKVLIGCDGLNSVVAKSLGLEAPRLFPMHAVRGLTNYPNGHIYGSNAFRIRAHHVIFGRFPVNSKLVYWFIGRQNHPTDSEVTKDPRGIQDFSLEILKGFPTDVIEMVGHCDLDSISFTHIRYQAPWNILFANLQRGTMTIAGDAMHAMGPFLGQGGNCGLEDAIVLARCLSRELNTGLGREINDLGFKKRAIIALKDYVKERRPRVMRLATQSYLAGSLVAANSWAKRVLYLAILKVFFGGMSLSHTRYDCGPI